MRTSESSLRPCKCEAASSQVLGTDRELCLSYGRVPEMAGTFGKVDTFSFGSGRDEKKIIETGFLPGEVFCCSTALSMLLEEVYTVHNSSSTTTG